ncbi:MAG: LuxR C-terminal-related transcriptional regulator [Chitinophagaceae bacterium]
MTRYPGLLLILLLLFAANGQAQYDHLLNRSYRDRAADINLFITRCVDNPDTAVVLGWLKQLKQQAQKNNDRELVLEADLIRACYLERRDEDNDQRVIGELNDVIRKAREQRVLQIQARAYKLLGSLYWNEIKDVEMAFQQYLLEDKVLEQLSEDEFPDKLENIYYIGEAYYEVADYRQSIYFLLKALRIKPAEFNRQYQKSTRNTLGLAYQALGNLDSSDFYFWQVIASGQDPVWKGIAKGNLGQNQFLRGNYAAAIPLLIADYEEALRNNDSALASGSLMTLAEIAFRQNRIAEAAAYTLRARECILNARPPRQFRRFQFLYPLMSKMYMAEGNRQLAYLYVDSAMYVKDSLHRQYSSLKLLAAYRKIEQQQYDAELKKAEQEKRLKIMQRNFLLGFLFLLMIGVLFFYKNQRSRLRQERRIRELEMARVNQELATATVQLQDFARSVSERNQLVEELQQKIGTNTNSETTARLYQSTILTNEEWQRFRTLFETVHKGYLKRLQEKMPDLSPSEVRLMTLAKLGFSNKEMAASLGVSPQAIRVSRHRLRKKLNLPEEGSLEELVNSI